MSERYTPLPDLEGINSQQTSPLKDLGWLLLGFVAIVSVLYLVLGAVGEWLFLQLSPEQEMALFTKLNLTSSLTTHESTHLSEIKKKLLGERWPNLRVNVMCLDEINAFALPGGQILFTSGLLKKIKTEKGLAMILGHEVGHFENRDHLRGLGRAATLSLLATLAGLEVGSGLRIDLVGQIWERGHSREAEVKADAVGAELIASAYGNLAGATELFEMNQTAEKSSGVFAKSLQKVSSLWLSHPPSEERIAAMKVRIDSQQEKNPPNLNEKSAIEQDFSIVECAKSG